MLAEYETHQKLNFQPEITLFSINVKGYLIKYGQSLGVDNTGASSSKTNHSLAMTGSGNGNSVAMAAAGAGGSGGSGGGGANTTATTATATLATLPSASTVWSLSVSSMDQVTPLVLVIYINPD